MCHLPISGTEPTSPALAGRFFLSGPPEKSPSKTFLSDTGRDLLGGCDGREFEWLLIEYGATSLICAEMPAVFTTIAFASSVQILTQCKGKWHLGIVRKSFSLMEPLKESWQITLWELYGLVGKSTAWGLDGLRLNPASVAVQLCDFGRMLSLWLFGPCKMGVITVAAWLDWVTCLIVNLLVGVGKMQYLVS